MFSFLREGKSFPRVTSDSSHVCVTSNYSQGQVIISPTRKQDNMIQYEAVLSVHGRTARQLVLIGAIMEIFSPEFVNNVQP